MEIVYCGGCGRLLRRDEFDRGLARFLDNRPWCSDCKPPDKDPIPTSSSSARRQQGSTAKIPRISVGTTRRETVVPAASRSALIGIGIAVVALVLLAAVYAGNRSTPSAPMVEKAPRGGELDRNVTQREDARRALQQLESLASLAPPDKILARCDEIRSKFLKLPEERRFLEIQNAAQQQKRTRDQESQFTRDWEVVRRLMDEDLRYARVEEVERRLKALREIAGARTGDVDRLSADYRRDRQISPQEKREGPFFEDDQGFVRNWLILGVYPSEKDRGLDVDFLKTEAAANPLSGQEVGKPKWAAYASPEARIDFFKVPHLGIKPPKDNVVAYAFCVVQVSEQVASEIRLGSDDGAALWIDGTAVGKVHKPRVMKVDEDRYRVPLAPGVHRLLLKVENHSKSYEFVLRIVSVDGKPLPGLRIWN